jgi:hypothetical protein
MANIVYCKSTGSYLQLYESAVYSGASNKSTTFRLHSILLVLLPARISSNLIHVGPGSGS